MEAKELRIGNWVNFDDHLIKEQQVTYLRKDADLSDVSPLFLTEEWLVKFGFEKPMNGSWFSNDKLEIDLSNGFRVFLLGGVKSIEIKHVHQLQNLYFALTGEELTKIGE